MSNLITARIEKKTDNYVVRKEINNKKDSETKQVLVPILQAHQSTKKRPHRKASTNENFLTCQTQAAIVTAIVKAIRYAKTS